MKKLYVCTAIGCLFTAFVFNFHVIRMDKGFDIIAKDRMNLRENYVDARDFDPAMLLDCSPRVRSYILYRVYGSKLLSEIRESGDASAESVKKTLRESEQALHEWLSDKLK